MRASLGIVKREIRVLGIDLCNPNVVVGAVVRGGLYLDGVVAFPVKLRTRQLAETIRQTKYYPELKAVMVHGSRGSLNFETLERITRLPAILVSHDRPSLGQGAKVFGERPERLWIRTGLDRSSLKKLLSSTRSIGRLPEPVRVAHLLAKLHISERISQDKG
jgi:endonuclease V-like protein UPF0215 family